LFSIWLIDRSIHPSFVFQLFYTHLVLGGSAFLLGLSSGIHTAWPAHQNLEIFMVLTISGSENSSYNSLLYLTCQNPSSHTEPNILQSTFLSKTLKFPLLLVVNAQLALIHQYRSQQCFMQSQI
jgi:hypothetical protein